MGIGEACHGLKSEAEKSPLSRGQKEKPKGLNSLLLLRPWDAGHFSAPDFSPWQTEALVQPMMCAASPMTPNVFHPASVAPDGPAPVFSLFCAALGVFWLRLHRRPCRWRMRRTVVPTLERRISKRRSQVY